MFGRATIRLGIGPHSSFGCFKHKNTLAAGLRPRTRTCWDILVFFGCLLLNPTKTEVLWCSYSRRQHQIPTGPIRGVPLCVCLHVAYEVALSTEEEETVALLCCRSLDADVTTRAHVNATAKKYISALGQSLMARAGVRIPLLHWY